MTWHTHAACRGTNVETFFPPRGATTRETNAAKAICATCTVRTQCLEWALHHEKIGVWGGTTRSERMRMRKRLGIVLETPVIVADGDSMMMREYPRSEAVCGTDGGYYRHIRSLGEDACDDCRAAHAEVERERKKKARAS